MAHVTSYISEHTAEFVLIPDLKNILSKKHKSVIPIYPWLTREGSNISFQLHDHDEFRILGLYPRRPKIYSVNQENIFIKVNEHLLYSARIGLEFGIPIIAGCPIASNFWELRNCPCLWIKLESDIMESFEIQLQKNNTSNLISKYPDSLFQTNEDLITYIDKTSKVINLGIAFDAIKKINMQRKGVSFYNIMSFMGGYKPVYFLLK
ncbi:hypothetical protein ACFL4T_01440 [candidate division KSB1 bacterium]